MIQDLDDKQKEADKSAKELRQKLLEAQRLHSELKAEFSAYQKEKEALKEKAKAEANAIVEETKKKADAIIEDLRQKQLESGSGQGVKEHEFIEAQTQLSGLQQEEERLKENKVLKREKEKRALKVGQNVKVQSLGQQGVLVEQMDEDWVVQMGMLKMRLPEDDLLMMEQEPEKSTTSYSGSMSSVRPELDLRGERVEAALSKLDQYLDQALLANYKNVTIIHGHGTGAVRSAVQNALKKYPRVNSFKTAPANQGGTGATIVSLK